MWLTFARPIAALCPVVAQHEPNHSSESILSISEILATANPVLKSIFAWPRTELLFGDIQARTNQVWVVHIRRNQPSLRHRQAQDVAEVQQGDNRGRAGTGL